MQHWWRSTHQGPKDDEKVKEVNKVAKEVKDIQTMVRKFTFQAQELLPSSSGFHPIFVHLLAQAPLGFSILKFRESAVQ